MPMECQILTLRVQVTERLDELLLLEESRIQAMSALEQKQQQTRAFVDRHRRQTQKAAICNQKTSIGFPNENGVHARKAPIQMDRAILDNRQQEWYVSSWYIVMGDPTKMG